MSPKIVIMSMIHSASGNKVTVYCHSVYCLSKTSTFNIMQNKINLFSVSDSLGIVLTRGYGQYIFTGNVSVEEGKSPSSVSIYLSFLLFLAHMFFSVLLQVFMTYWLQI